MHYLPLTEADREEMRRFLGIGSTRELFRCTATGACDAPVDGLPKALAESELLRRFREYAARNRFDRCLSFLGGGVYAHFIPEVVNHLSAKGEFVTPYTPYQPEVSQGNLQAMFEYQTMMVQLTGLDVANASLYDGGSAAAEGALLAVRKSGRRRLLAAASLHPEHLEIVRAYIQHLGVELETVAWDPASGRIDAGDLAAKLNGETAALLLQSPNFFGVVEDVAAAAAAVHGSGAALVQVVAEAMSLAMLTPPGANGVDIAVGEAQSFGLPVGFGGPLLGFLAARADFLRQLPGRIVGQTVDVDGKRGYVLTLSTREQHIKREKATSNICTNQAWCAVRAGMYLAVMGKGGLRQAARASHLNAAYFAERVRSTPGVAVRFPRGFFNEVVLDVTKGTAAALQKKLQKQGILAGVPLGWFFPRMKNALLLAFTEQHRREDIDRLVAAIGGRS